MRWAITVYHSPKNLQLQAELVYQSNQVQRFRVSGKNRGIVLQNNFPLLQSLNSKKKIDWKLIEGTMTDAELLLNIIREPEKKIKVKGDFIEYLRTKKGY